MLQSYSAEINGSQLVWLDVPPSQLAHRRVLVVVEEATAVRTSAKRFDFADLAGRLKWWGDAVAAQRTQRDGW